MENIKEFTKEQLENKKTLTEISKVAEFSLRYENSIPGDKTVEINKIRIQLEKGLRRNSGQISKDIYNKYQNYLAGISLAFLGMLGEKRVIELFQKHYLKMVKAGIQNDLKIDRKLKSLVYSMSSDSKKDPFLQDIKQALKENIEELGSKSVEINGKPRNPAIKNWIADYDNLVGAGEHGELDISNYLFKSKNTKTLSSDEKKILKETLRLYERLKLDMTHPNGIAAYPLHLVGVKSIGQGLDKKYLPEDPEEYKAEIEKRKKAREEKRKIVRGELLPENLIGQRSNLTPKRTQVQNTPSQEQNLPQAQPKSQPLGQEVTHTKSDFEKKKEEKFAGLTAIPKISLAKLSTAPSLQKLTVEDFRSYGSDAQSRGAYISNKIRKLLESSPENKEAIKHYLRKSELYKVYLSQRKESLDSKKDIAEIAHNRKNKGEKYLEKEEFEVLKGVLRGI